MTMFRTLPALLLAFVLAHAATAADLTPTGPYRVGFHVRQQYDRARVYQRARSPVTFPRGHARGSAGSR